MQAAQKYSSPLTAQNAALALFSLPTDGSMELCQKGSWFVCKESFSHYFSINCNSYLTGLLSPVTYNHMIRTLNFNVLYVGLRHFLDYFLIILFVFLYTFSLECIQILIQNTNEVTFSRYYLSKSKFH